MYYAKYYAGKIALRENKKVERKIGDNCIKNGTKGLKIASFWVINFSDIPTGEQK